MTCFFLVVEIFENNKRRATIALQDGQETPMLECELAWSYVFKIISLIGTAFKKTAC